VTVGGETLYNMRRASSNDVQHSPRLAIDSNPATYYSSRRFHSATNDRDSYLAAWLAGGRKVVSKVVLVARMRKGETVAFPTRYTVYLRSSDDEHWTRIGTFRADLNAAGVATIQLPSSYATYGVKIVPRALNKDDDGQYFFQLAEIGLAR
jgi:hypothetical protein